MYNNKTWSTSRFRKEFTSRDAKFSNPSQTLTYSPFRWHSQSSLPMLQSESFSLSEASSGYASSNDISSQSFSSFKNSTDNRGSALWKRTNACTMPRAPDRSLKLFFEQYKEQFSRYSCHLQ